MKNVNIKDVEMVSQFRNFETAPARCILRSVLELRDQTQVLGMSKIRVAVKRQNDIYIHNDLANVAYHFKVRFDEMERHNQVSGITLEIMAALPVIAFAIEAHVNFFGERLIQDWKEQRLSFAKKVEIILEHFDIEHDTESRPLSTIYRVKEFRNMIAHGKPVTLEENAIITTTHDELNAMGGLTAEWEGLATKEFFDLAYQDMECICRMLIDRSGMDLFDTLSGGSRGIEFIEHVD